MSLKSEEEKKEKQLISIKIEDIPEKEHIQLFNMYKDTYSNAKQPLWFNTKEELINRYPCLMCYNGEYKKLYVLYQFKNKFNKISLVCHNGTDDEKKNSIKIRQELVSMPGWMLEASGATSWLLRRYEAPIIEQEADIKSALDISDDNKNDRIEMNLKFNKNDKNYKTDKNLYQYTRVYNDTKANKEYRTNEIMFGTAPCEYTSQECDRKCNEIKKGGYKKRNTKKRNNKKRNTKKRNNKKRNTNRKL